MKAKTKQAINDLNAHAEEIERVNRSFKTTKQGHTPGPECALWCKENMPMVAAAPELLRVIEATIESLESCIPLLDAEAKVCIKDNIRELKEAIAKAEANNEG